VSKITSANGKVSSFLKRSVASVKNPESDPITTSPLFKPEFHSPGSKYLLFALLFTVIVNKDKSGIAVV
jgi:hypothetical protein